MRHFKQYLLMGALLLLGNSVFAESKVTIDFTTKGYENTQLVETIEQDGITLTFDMGTNKNAPKYYNTGTAVRCYGGNVISISATKNISRIDFVFSSGEGGNNIIPSEGRLDSTVWVGSSQYFTLTIDGTTGHRRFQKMEFTLEDAVVESRTATTIQFTEGYQTQIARGPDGMFPEIGSSVALPTAIVKADSASIPNADVEWSLEVKSWKSKGEGELPVLENGRISFEGYGVIEVKASFAGNDDYLASSKSYTLTVYNSYGKLSEMVLDIVDINGDKNDEDDKDGKPVFYFFRDIDADGFPALTNTVTYTNGVYTYLSDDEGNNLLFYGANTQNLKQGDKISGNVGDANLGGFWGNLKRYRKLPEFAFTDMNVKVESEGNVVEPTTIAADKLAEYVNAYVKIENAQFVSVEKKNLVFKVGEIDLVVYNQFNVNLDTLEVDATYTLTGMVSVYNTTKQLYVIDYVKTGDAVIVDPQPVDTVHIANTAETAYTIAEAIRLIEAGQALDETVFVKGFISQIDMYYEETGSITYWISEDGTTESTHLECYRGMGLNGTSFASFDDLEIGAEVIVKGQLKKYKDIYEFNSKNELVSYVGPEVVDPNLIEIAQDQGKTLDDFARTELVIGDDYNTYTCTESIQIAFKMLDIDVKDCDYVVIKFAEPVAAGWELSLWGNNDNSTVAVPEGATEYKYVFAEDAKCAIANDVLPQITMLHLWTGTTPLVAKVKGIYKHKSAEQQPIEELTIQKDALAEAIAKGGMFNALAYTDASFSALSIAITDGEAALIDAAATAESLTAATTAVYNAIAALVLKDGFSSLQDVPFGQWSGWGADAELTQTINPTWDLFTATGHSYGDIGVNNYADVSAYDKLYVTYTDGTPRILMNRDVDNGQWNENEAESHLIDNTRGGWSAKYFTTEDGIVTVDLKQMATDKGFAHITAIKGANYANVTVTGLYLYKAPAVVPEIVTKKTVFTGELKSMDELQSNKFMLQSEDGMVLYTPDGWDVKVADLLTATSNMSNGGFFELNPLDGDYEGMYQIPIYNLDGSRRTYWAGYQSLNSQPNGNIIFGLSGEAPDYGQDGPNLALWTITYDENKGFAFHCVGRDIYLGCDESAARPVDSIVYWKAYTGFDAAYDVAEVLAAYEAVISAAKIQETIMTLTDAKAAYDDYGDINEFGKVVNAAIDDVKYCETLNETYSHLDETGAKVAAEIRRLYNKGAYWSVEELAIAYRRAVMAQTTAGSDFTAVIINPSFETGKLNGWISDNGGATANNGNFGAATGSFFVERWVNSANVLSDGSLTQVISGLPAGKYVLTAEMQNLEQGNGSADGEGYYLFANNNRTAVTYAGETVVVETVLAAGDDLIIGTLIDNCTGNWVCVDNFHLTLVDPAAIIPVEDDPELEVPEGWMSMIYNGNLSSDDTYSFYSKEAPITDYYPAAIVPGAGVNGSRGIVVKSADNPGDAWDSQFWIRLNEALPAGARLHVEFDYMANQYAHTTTQAHGEPGAYQYFAAIGDVDFYPEWQHYIADVEVTSDMATANGGNGLLSIAFNLSEEQTATEYHFDNFAVWAKMPEPVEEWVDIMVNGDMEGESTECFYVTEQGLGGPYLAEITDGIGKNRSRAIMVQSQDSPNNSWDTQFFIRLPYQLPAGTPFRVTFDVKANKAAYFSTETHSEPSGYIYWGAIGSYGVDVWWETYEVEGVVTSDMSNEKNMMQTIAFDLAESSDATQYIFDNIKFEVPASVLDSLILNPAEDPRPYPAGRMGDVNTDREINITDVVLIIEDILQREPQNYNAELADVNKDGYIDVSDVVMVIDAILGKVELSRGAELIDRSAYTAFQMDLTIPAGYVLESVSLTEIAKNSHSLAYAMLPDGRCRVVVCSMNNEALPGAWDEVISLNLRGKGDAQVNIDRAVFVTIDGERHELMMNPTSIAQISNLNSQISNLYDLQGRKVEKTSKGILIENGKKIFK